MAGACLQCIPATSGPGRSAQNYPLRTVQTYPHARSNTQYPQFSFQMESPPVMEPKVTPQSERLDYI